MEQRVVESDQEVSPYIPVPTICISVMVAGAKSPALIDTGASVNTVSLRIATCSNLPCLLVHPPSALDKHFTPRRFLSKKSLELESTSPQRTGRLRRLPNSLLPPLPTQRWYSECPSLYKNGSRSTPPPTTFPCRYPRPRKPDLCSHMPTT